MKNLMVLGVIWLVWLMIGILIGYFAIYSPELNLLSESGVQTYGVVNSTEPENHAMVIYSFRVNDRTFQGASSSGDGTKPFKDIKVGQEIVVTYDSNNPEISIAGWPQTEIRARYPLIVVFGIALSLMPMGITSFLYLWFFRRKLQKSTCK